MVSYGITCQMRKEPPIARDMPVHLRKGILMDTIRKTYTLTEDTLFYLVTFLKQTPSIDSRHVSALHELQAMSDFTLESRGKDMFRRPNDYMFKLKIIAR